MSTVQERAEADQDDADRYAQHRAIRRTSHRAHIHELTTEIDRLRAVACDREDTVIERDVTIAQLQEHAEHETDRLQVKVNLARLQRDYELMRGEHARQDAHVAQEQRDKALAAIERVRALHVSEDNDRDAEWCVHDRMTWPCPTIAALNAPTERLRQGHDRAWFSYLIACPVCRAKARS